MIEASFLSKISLFPNISTWEISAPGLLDNGIADVCFFKQITEVAECESEI